jgi:small multidrug resistance family-3 protein
MELLKTAVLFVITALAEILGCYLPYLWLQKGKTPWLLLPAAISLAAFSWLLTLHPIPSGRIYAAYGGVYVTAAVCWLWAIDGIRPTPWDMVGAALCLTGMAVIALSPK